MREPEFWAAMRPAPSGCWEWSGYRDANGYGRVTWDRPGRLAHRVAALLSGWAIDGLEVCHSCDNPPCCNPAHLFVGTRLDNARDAVSKGRLRAQQVTQCPQGHPYDEANTRIRYGRRYCQACHLRRQRDRRRRAGTL